MKKPNFVHGFSFNSKCGSKIIRWGTRLDGQEKECVPSHYFIVFFRKIVLESRLDSGVRLTFWGWFKKKNDIVKLFIPIGDQEIREKQGNMFNDILERVYGRPYDKMAVLYFAYRILLKKIFGKPMPEKNKLNDPKKFFCDEIFSVVSGEDMSMKSPNDLMILMMNAPKSFEEISAEEVKS